MAHKHQQIALIVLFACACSQLVSSASLIELNDANKAILNLNLSKNLQAVQDAFSNNYKFTSVKNAYEFLTKCQSLKASMEAASDADYEGMAANIKALLAEQTIVDGCAVDRTRFFDRFAVLDKEFSVEDLAYLSEKKLNQLIEFNQQVNSDAGLQVLLGYLLQKRIDGLGERLLSDGAKDTSIMFDEHPPSKGMFDFDIVYKKGCEISKLMPICKLVRGSPHDSVTVYGDDVKDFVQAIDSNDQNTVGKLQQKSGVDLDSVKDECNKMVETPIFKVAKQIDGYKQAGFLDEQKIDQSFSSDEYLALYYEVYHLCSKLSN